MTNPYLIKPENQTISSPWRRTKSFDKSVKSYLEKENKGLHKGKISLNLLITVAVETFINQ